MLIREACFQVNAPGCSLGGKTRSKVLDQVSQQETCRMERKLPRLGEGEGLQIVHESRKKLGLLQRGVDVFGRGLINTVQDSFKVALNYVKRGAEFVGDVGGQIAALL